MNNQELQLMFEKNNPWWVREFSLDYKPRRIYAEMRKFMHLRHILALSGLRRAGKTTIMSKIIMDNLGIYPKENIFYFSFDDNSNIRLMHILDQYASHTHKDLRKDKLLVFFDEIQKVENWNEQLKVIYDLYPNVKIILSGSESLFIRKKIRESLAGRMFEFHIDTLQFSEFLEFRGKRFDNLNLFREDILKEFEQFIFCSGFPEIVSEPKEVCEKYVKENVIDKILFKDLPQLVPIGDIALLDSVLKIILNDPGEMINLEELAKDLGSSRQTISTYLDYLEKSFLIRKLYNYSRNPRKTQRRHKKYYSNITPFLILQDKNLYGKVFENAMVHELQADFFWRDLYKNEIDIIKPDPLEAIEIKSGEVKERDLVPLKRFIKKFNPKEALVITYDIKKTLGGIKLVPFYDYLLK